MNEVVSVVVPCLNRSHFLRPTIESILKQDYPHIECIVVDGGSTDDTMKILKEYGERIRWISEPDHGHSDAINKGWKMSTGQILAWLNADDIWQIPSAVSTAVSYLDEHPDTDVLYGDCGSIDVDGNYIGMSYLRVWDLEYAVENCDHCIPQPAAFIRRAIFERVDWLDPKLTIADHDLWLRISLVGKIAYLPVTLAHARNEKGLSFQGRLIAPDCIQLTKKFFRRTDIPLSILNKKKIAFRNAYLRGMQYAWRGGRVWSIILRYAVMAAVSEPSNCKHVFLQLHMYVVSGYHDEKRLFWAYAIMNFLNKCWQIFHRIKEVIMKGRKAAG